MVQKVGNTSKINVLKSGQYVITMPKAIAQSMRLSKGDDIEWIFDKGDVLVRKS